MSESKKSMNEHKEKTQNQILKNLSHELRTPLSGIEHTFFLLKKTRLTAEQKSYLSIGEEALLQLSKHIDALISLKEIEDIKIEEKVFNLEEELIQLIIFYAAQFKLRSIDFIFNFDYDIKTFYIGDLIKLKSILRHLLDNSYKFTHQGSVLFQVKKIDSMKVSFTIEDTGEGMDEETISHLSKAYIQKDMSDQRTIGGLGIGLTIANAYVKALGGALKVESTVNKGTKVSFELSFKLGDEIHFSLTHPYVMLSFFKKMNNHMISSMGFKSHKDASPDFIFFDDETIKELKAYQLKYADQKTKCVLISETHARKTHGIDLVLLYPISRTSIMQSLFQSSEHDTYEPDYQPMLSGYALIVDDNRLNRIALQSILMKQGVQSKTVESGLLAIDAVKKETFDIILMDVQMPNMDGMEATRRIRALGKTYQKIPIIAVTANAYFNDYDLLKTSQMTDVIFKPIKTESLNPVLRKYLKPSPEIMIPENLYIFDENEFSTRFNGSMDIAKEVIETFLNEYPKDMKKIEESIHIKHAEHIIKHVHYFKGSCSYLSAQRIVWLINLIMDHAKHQNLEFMDALYKQLLSETKKLIELLKAFTYKL